MAKAGSVREASRGVARMEVLRAVTISRREGFGLVGVMVGPPWFLGLWMRRREWCVVFVVGRR